MVATLDRLIAVRSQLAQQRLHYEHQVLTWLEQMPRCRGGSEALLAPWREHHEAFARTAQGLDDGELPVVVDLARLAQVPADVDLTDAILSTVRARFAPPASFERILKRRLSLPSCCLVLVRGEGDVDHAGQLRLNDLLNGFRLQAWRSRIVVLGPGREGLPQATLQAADVGRIVHWFSRPPAPEHVDITRLPSTGEHLLGRSAELEWLDEAWDARAIHIVTLAGWGGIGKTTLVRHWINRMREDSYRGAERAFAWSFYTEGADRFLMRALEFFGDHEMATSAAPAPDKGRRLAQLAGTSRSLLVLDGVEPLQYGAGPRVGEIKEPGLGALLLGLADSSRGLCVVTTRQPVVNLDAFRTTTAPVRPLEGLSSAAGAALLHRLGVQRAAGIAIEADHVELREAAATVKGHALTLRLLGHYLALAHRGDVRARTTIDFADADAVIEGGHGFRVLQAYERWLAEDRETGEQLIGILRLLALFDRPADPACLNALRARPPIPALTDLLVQMSDREWNAALERLGAMGLVSLEAGTPSAVDTHPLVRAYFATGLLQHPDAMREGHRRLYEHLTRTADQLPDTIDAMEPLFQAIRHGCAAGLHQEVHDQVFVSRIQRGDLYFSNYHLGSYSEEIAALGAFFARPWDVPVPNLDRLTRASVLHSSAFDLFRLGRLDEAVQAFRAAERHYRQEKHYAGLIVVGWALNQLYLLRGDIAEAEAHAGRLVRLSDRIGEPSQMTGSRILHARARVQAGHLPDRAFDALYPRIVRLRDRIAGIHAGDYAVGVYALFDVLLSRVEPSGAPHAPIPPRRLARFVARATDNLRMLERVIRQDAHTSFAAAIADLIAGRTLLVQCANGASDDWSRADASLGAALAGFTVAAMQEYVAYTLLARAMLKRHRGRLTDAGIDLSEAFRIGVTGGMTLHQADCWLEQACLRLATGDVSGARIAVERAAQIIYATTYHRRDTDVRALRSCLAAFGAT